MMPALPQVVAQAVEDPEGQAQAQATFDRNRRWAKPAESYQTALPPDREAAFRQWVQANQVPFNPDDPYQDYDMRGYWQDIGSRGQDERQVNENDGLPHYPDTYKTPYHQSFSNESRYAAPDAPRWVNDYQLVDPKTGQVIFDERARK